MVEAGVTSVPEPRTEPHAGSRSCSTSPATGGICSAPANVAEFLRPGAKVTHPNLPLSVPSHA
jgi:hypothetical protein